MDWKGLQVAVRFWIAFIVSLLAIVLSVSATDETRLGGYIRGAVAGLALSAMHAVGRSERIKP